ncbi:MAG TPA: PAS domain S-box protein [Candidatus Angelobacter sp.]|nr:PAS domain S-box protein [Candidatus Angelobacter sp.]
MPMPFSEFIVFCVMGLLVLLFVWTWVRDRQPPTGVWMLGWMAILVHFGAAWLHSLNLIGDRTTNLLKLTTLEVAGICFELSVSETCRTNRRRILFIALLGVPSIIYVVCSIYLEGHMWVYPALIGICVFGGVYIMSTHYTRRSIYAYAFCLIFGAPGVLIIPVILRAPGYGVPFMLFEYFTVTGILYWRHFHRITPGVVFTSLSFIYWGVSFPVAFIPKPYHIGPEMGNFFWELPQFFVAFGMVLTLFETQAEAATIVARRYRDLFEGNLASVYLSTFDGHLMDCNSAFIALYGFASKEEALAADMSSLYVSPQARRKFVSRLQNEKQLINYECEQRRKDGTRFWILERANLITGPDGKPILEGTSIDITERKEAELALKQSEERFATMFRQSPTGCVIVSLEGVFIDVNDNFLRLLQLPAEQVLGKTAAQLGLWSASERETFFAELKSKGSIRHWPIEFKDAHGHRHMALYFASLVSVGEKECIFGMLLDRTEQQELETKFLHAQKMDALGRLAGGVAHDFNNLLGVLGGYAELLQSKLGHQETWQRYCQKILETTQRATGLTRQLLTFSRKEITRPSPMQIDQAIREFSGILPRLIGEDIELKLHLGSSGTVVIDKTHFEQILLNIVVNAREAMPDGGHLWITTDDCKRPATPPGSAPCSDCVAIHFRDTGVGMDEHTRAHAFDPFFTTKEVGRGTGLGLSTVYGIVQQSKGDIELKSELGKGTEISIFLPCVVPPAPSASPEERPVEVKAGVGHILLVEDETELRNTTAEYLTSIGYSVASAGSGPEALRLALNNQPIDLVITDVVMPKMNGREFADRLRQLRPGVKILFVSGYADDVILHTGISLQLVPFLQKPFSLRHLGAKVNELMTVAAR